MQMQAARQAGEQAGGRAGVGAGAHLLVLMLQAAGPNNLQPLPAQSLPAAVHCHSVGGTTGVCPWCRCGGVQPAEFSPGALQAGMQAPRHADRLAGGQALFKQQCQ